MIFLKDGSWKHAWTLSWFIFCQTSLFCSVNDYDFCIHLENLRIRRFFTPKSPDPEILRLKISGSGDFVWDPFNVILKTLTMKLVHFQSTKRITMHCETWIRRFYSKKLFIMITKWMFWGSVFRKISESGDFSLQNLRIRRFWDWKSPDPEILYEIPLIWFLKLL